MLSISPNDIKETILLPTHLRKRDKEDKLEIHTIELPKLFKKVNVEDDLFNWAKFFSIEDRKELEAMYDKNEYIDKACNKVLQLSEDDIKKLEYEERLKNLRDYRVMMNQNLKQGREEGRRQGIKEGIKEGLSMGQDIKLIKQVAKKLCNGKTIKQIADELEEDMEVISSISNAIEKSEDKDDVEKIYNKFIDNIEKL